MNHHQYQGFYWPSTRSTSWLGKHGWLKNYGQWLQNYGQQWQWPEEDVHIFGNVAFAAIVISITWIWHYSTKRFIPLYVDSNCHLHIGMTNHKYCICMGLLLYTQLCGQSWSTTGRLLPQNSTFELWSWPWSLETLYDIHIEGEMRLAQKEGQ